MGQQSFKNINDLDNTYICNPTAVQKFKINATNELQRKPYKGYWAYILDNIYPEQYHKVVNRLIKIKSKRILPDNFDSITAISMNEIFSKIGVKHSLNIN